ncbi:hypothetical protein SASPL_146308 [Salvia splendens]|uniref:Trypsin family protein n=1 Tax=Salvia splendens TaxID=180675 RepID=A0A8X8Z5N1_SALSN|nr:hypothetical protein SASPL_146308 [Salvia splendens]
MDQGRSHSRARGSGSTPSEESSLDLEKYGCNHSFRTSLSPSSLQPHATGDNIKTVLPESVGPLPEGQRANTLLELMTIRAFHSKILRCYSLGTAVGFRIRRGVLTNIPAILVFVSRKVHKQWLTPLQCLPTALEGPGGIWCDVDVLEFSYFGARQSLNLKNNYILRLLMICVGVIPVLVLALRYTYSLPLDITSLGGCYSSVANQEAYGTLGAIVRSQTGSRQVGFLTNRHVAVDLDYPNQKMFHPLPPTLGPGVYLGAVERATSFIRDDLWFGIFAGINPDDFDMSAVTTFVKGNGEIGNVKTVDLQSSIDSLVGKQVMKVGRSSGLTTGTVLAYALEYNDEKGICFLTDFLVVGENQQTFDLEGDSGEVSSGRLKLKVGQPPENWTSGVDLGRLLNFLELDLITADEALRVAVQEQRAASMTVVGSTAGDSSPPDVMLLPKDKHPTHPLGRRTCPSFEHQFIPCYDGKPAVHHDDQQDRVGSGNLSLLRNACDQDLNFSLQLVENEPKRRKSEPTPAPGME